MGAHKTTIYYISGEPTLLTKKCIHGVYYCKDFSRKNDDNCLFIVSHYSTYCCKHEFDITAVKAVF